MTSRPSLSFLLSSSFFLLAFFCLALYLLSSRLTGFLGFPLDDAWIHQTYARTFAQTGQWAFIPGQPSAGSTSPLWTLFLSLGYFLRVEYRAWTYALGALLLGLNAWLAYRLALSLWPERRAAAWLAGLCVALEWHLIWAAASGMETLLFSALALAVFVIPPRRSGWLGALVGLSLFARPDGLTLLPFALLRVWLASSFAIRFSPFASRSGSSLYALRFTLFAFALLCLSYLAFNQALGGDWWPNTFAAKQAEYAVMRSAPMLTRLSRVAVPPFIGALAVLSPGVLAGLWGGVRRQAWSALLPLLWVVSFIAAYVLRLPVDYQHGRYVMPVIPVLAVLGVGGLASVARFNSTALLPRVLSRAWALTAGVVLLAFVFIGAQGYARDVQFIESEMVTTARWVNQNLPPTARLAAHDIGALGYFGGRPLLDLAGLVSPEVIPFIRDEARLHDWLNAQGATHLVIFPDWYTAQLRPTAADLLFATSAPYGPAQGTTNMGVYRWPLALP